MEIVIPVVFGLESVVKQELEDFGYGKSQIVTDNGQVVLSVSEPEISRAVAKCNIKLRTAERVLLKTGEGTSRTFDELFDLTSKIRWEEYIPDGWAFHVNGYSRKSDLFGIPSCQGIIKKSIVKRLVRIKNIPEGKTLPEDELAGIVKIVFSIVNNKVSFMIDTTGDGLHKRGYRPLSHSAPIKETLAAGLVMLSRWTTFKDEALIDPMCGSGTIPIEAAMIAMNIAPGVNRSFFAEKWPFISKKEFDEIREECLDSQRFDIPEKKYIFAGDISYENIKIATENARRANVDHLISFERRDAKTLTPEKIEQLTSFDKNLIITNPPYGERMLEKKDAQELYKAMGINWIKGKSVAKGLRVSIIAPCDVFEEDFGLVADKRRKLYNGMIPCNMYHYFKFNK